MLFPDPQANRPDFILATTDGIQGVWVVAEMTIGSKSASDVQRQIQAGLDAVTHSEGLPMRSAPRIPVVLHRREKRVAALQRLGEPTYRVEIAGHRRRIRERFCGDTISAVLILRRGE